MFKTRLGGCVDGAKAHLGYVETDPSRRYGRFREILGKGATKTVYKAFDEIVGMEVAWNQVKLSDVFRSPDEMQRLYSEVHLLKSLKHDSIIKFYTSWIDVDRRTFNFITEMFTSGTLREYRLKYQRVDIRAVKNWARQILRGLAYLHGSEPPVIHRDLKCDNIFVNGHLGQVKIGDLGLAAILRGSQLAHSVIGTPEFMAPELYEEEYNELVDIYSFGMCVLEMLTSEYPYSECSNPAQIYKKVTSGKLPEAFYRIEDLEARKFVGKCLENASKRLPARELLLDPFLASDHEGEAREMPLMHDDHDHDPTRSTNMTITGSMNPEDDTIFLKVQISDHKDGHARNIYFPFDIVNDTAIDVAMEMVKELEITEWDPFEIAEMIEEQISSLVPTWKKYGSPRCRHHHHHHHHHSFNYYEEEDDDEENLHPFYASSSHSSSPAFKSAHDTHFFHGKDMASAQDWLQEDLFLNDDASSQSSLNSMKCSNLNYSSGNEDEYDSSLRGGDQPTCNAKNHKSTRFCPSESFINANNVLLDSQKCYNPNHRRKMTRIRSFVDVRSQLLHRSLVEEINKRRLFKTVGAVENIGYQEPSKFSGNASTGSGFYGRSYRDGEKQGFEW